MAKTIHYHVMHEFETDKEANSSKILNLGNIQMIENMLYYERNRKANLEVDPTNVVKFIQAEAECTGAITALQTLLDNHKDTIQSFNPESPTA